MVKLIGGGNMADVKIDTRTMHSKYTKWVYNETEEKWYGTCLECKGVKAKYTPQQLKQAGLKPCGLCTDLVEYEKASSHTGKEVRHDQEEVAA